MSQNCNTIAIGRPSPDGMSSAKCQSSCSNLGPVDPLNKSQLGPRPNRIKVREQIKDYILFMLGAPTLKIELDEQAIDFCCDQALKIVEEYAGREYYTYYTFVTTPGQSVYEMPPDVGYIRNVFYNKMPNFAFNASDLGGVIPVEYFTGFGGGGGGYSTGGGIFTPQIPQWGHMGEWVLYKQYEQMYSRLGSQIGGWEWVGGYGHIKLYPTPCGGTTVIVHYMQRMKDWREVTQAMQEGALTYAKEILGRIRGKYPAPPGPGGGMQLDGQALLSEAKEERDKWKEELIYKFGDLPYPSMD
jgi:hypothetical protein